MSQRLGRLSGVTKLYGFQPALSDVDLTLESGRFLSVVGPNGAGKTTLLKIIAGLSQPTRGSVELAARPEGIGYLSHQSLLYGELTALENLQFWAGLYGLQEPEARCRRLLERVELLDQSGRRVDGYSQGMKQRLSLARALLNDPSLLLLDEPFSGLDRHGSRLLSELLSSARSRGRTVVLVTHNLDEGVRLAERILLLDKGKIAFDGSTDELDAATFERTYLDLLDSRGGTP